MCAVVQVKISKKKYVGILLFVANSQCCGKIANWTPEGLQIATGQKCELIYCGMQMSILFYRTVTGCHFESKNNCHFVAAYRSE